MKVSIKNLWVFCCLFLHRYESPEIALNCGIMLRECIRHEPLAKIILWSEQFYDFFRYVEMSTFDIASDAFATFKVTSRAHLNNFCSFLFLPCKLRGRVLQLVALNLLIGCSSVKSECSFGS